MGKIELTKREATRIRGLIANDCCGCKLLCSMNGSFPQIFDCCELGQIVIKLDSILGGKV